ncbi:MAG: response regulator [Chloroflexota bacterium]
MSVRRVLIVDDDPHVRALLETTLSPETCEVIQAADGDEALQRASEWLPDLVLLDWWMPRVSGEEVLAELKRRLPLVRVIVLTAEIQTHHRDQARQLGADLFLTKPFSPLQLLEAIERLLPLKEG